MRNADERSSPAGRAQRILQAVRTSEPCTEVLAPMRVTSSLCLPHAGRLLLFALLACAGVPAAGEVQEMTVTGRSMEPALRSGRRVSVDTAYYEARTPARGDVVVVRFTGRERAMVKRVIAVGGDLVEMSAGRLWLNGQVLDEPYLASPRSLGERAATVLRIQLERHGGRVPAGHLIVLGDNPRVSRDSADYGFVSQTQVAGRVLLP